MAKDPAMLFYTSDFLTGVTTMSMKERGQYITLLCLQQQRGHLSLKEMRKAVGALSEELMSKFVEDADGKYYNRRAEKEIQKRASHCEAQRGNIAKRWNNQGNTTVDTTVSTTEHTTVIPLENEDEDENIHDQVKKEEESKDMEEIGGCGGKEDAALAQVFGLYMDRINPSPSPIATEELRHYTQLMGPEVVCRAIYTAADDNVRNWSYVQGILRNYKADGVRSVADAQRRDDEFQKAKQRKRSGAGSPSPTESAQPASGLVEIENMRKLYKKLKGGAADAQG